MYDGNLYGNACGMNGTADAFNNTHYVAIGSTNFDDGYGCGKCYTITCIGAYGDNPDCSCGSEPTITVQAIDQCPECTSTEFDLNDDMMAKITGSESMADTCGEITIEYERVDCTAITSNFYIENKSGTSQWWYGFHLNDVNDDGGISTVELYQSGSYIGYCDKDDDGPSYWLCTASSGTFPDDLNPALDIKITSDQGKSVTAYECITTYDSSAIMQCNTNLAEGSVKKLNSKKNSFFFCFCNVVQ